ncbi:MAG: diphthine--ammonia ligase [Candidatus Omnitrophota bacterium]
MQEKVAACSWSSGKDSCLSLYKAQQAGYEIKYIFNFISQEYKRVSFHGAKSELVKLQAEALGIPLMQRQTTQTNYEEIFTKTLQELKDKGINKIVRGDIHLIDLKDWVANICSKNGMDVVSPIWDKPTKEILNDFIEAGFKAIITSTQADKLGQDWLGRYVDKKFIDDLLKLPSVDLCGENGEYHTFVFDGPIFRQRIELSNVEKIKRDNYWFLELKKFKLAPKEGK